MLKQNYDISEMAVDIFIQCNAEKYENFHYSGNISWGTCLNNSNKLAKLKNKFVSWHFKMYKGLAIAKKANHTASVGIAAELNDPLIIVQ